MPAMPGLFRSTSNSSLDANNDESAIVDPAAIDNQIQAPQPNNSFRWHRPSARTLATSTNLSASFSQKTPARSFLHHSSLDPQDPVDYSSHGVRDHTAELASWALGDSAPAQLSPPNSLSGSTRRKRSSPHLIDNRDATASDAGGRTSSEHARPDVIEEEPEHMSTSTSPGRPRSGLADLFKPKSNISHQEQRRGRRPTVGSTSGGLDGGGSSLRAQRNDENVPLLAAHDGLNDGSAKHYGSLADEEGQATMSHKPNQLHLMFWTASNRMKRATHVLSHPKSWSAQALWEKGVKEPIGLIPCVFLGVLLNVLDALSYGMILFPLSEPVFANTGADGISMFYVSCIVSQLVYSSGGSIFKGAVGSEMIEVVPFFHKMTYTIMAKVSSDDPKTILATVITSYAMSSVLTGLVFFFLGAFKLGSLVSFFPRHILIGCIGGVGFFLFLTGIEVSSRIQGSVNFDLETARILFSGITVWLWIIPLLLSITLLVLKRFISSPGLVPAFFIGVAAIFYIVAVATPSLSVNDLRDQGWIFTKVEAGVPFYHFYTYYDFAAVDWKALSATIPAMFALTFFGILHVPINIPALGIAAQEDDVNLNRELIAHGFSNAISGFVGSIQNYLVYVNSEMFISNGGNNRLAGFMLAGATFGVLVAGPDMIGYVPVMVVGALIFYLGIALLEEALVDTWGRMSKLEYLTVLAIVLIMGAYDFVNGIMAGIVLACLNFVVQTSRKSAIRASYTGENVQSTVRRHAVQRDYLDRVGQQIRVMKLAGYLFFGSIVAVEKKSRALIDEEAFQEQPIRYLVFDLQHVNGLDYSAAEAFTRIERVISRRSVRVIICGVAQDDEVGKSLQSVGLWVEGSSAEFFENLNMALEFCENKLLATLYAQRDTLPGQQYLRARDISKPESTNPMLNAPTSNLAPIMASPRQQYLTDAANTTLDSQKDIVPPKRWSDFKQPLPLILQIFQTLSDKKEDFWFRAVSFFVQKEYQAETVLFERGDESSGFYLLSSGILRAIYNLPVGIYHESIVAGTTCGELPFFSNTHRTATVIAEKDCVCWVLEGEQWERMQQEWPEGAKELLKVALRLTVERMESVTSYVLTTAG